MKKILFLMISLMSLLSFASAEGTIPQTGWTTAVPAAYAAQSTHPGTVEELVYDTKDYAGNGADIQKKAYVYLPYGYDPDDAETRYDMHEKITVCHMDGHRPAGTDIGGGGTSDLERKHENR